MNLVNKKKEFTEKVLVVKLILNKELNLKCQTDLIDMQLQVDGDFKFIMVYQDYLTKCIQVRYLKIKRAEEVAYHLVCIFKIFGAPSIIGENSQLK